MFQAGQQLENNLNSLFLYEAAGDKNDAWQCCGWECGVTAGISTVWKLLDFKLRDCCSAAGNKLNPS